MNNKNNFHYFFLKRETFSKEENKLQKKKIIMQ